MTSAGQPHDDPGGAHPKRGQFVCSVICILILGVFAGVSTAPIFENVQNLGIADWDQHFFYHYVPAKTVLEYGQIPLWNPYYSGGNALLAYPQTRFLTPFFAFHLLWDTPVALKLEVFFHLWIGLAGGWMLCRFFGVNRWIALIGAVVIMGNGIFAHRMIAGHTWFLSQAYFPWVIYCFLGAMRGGKPIWPAAALIALMLFEGGIYTVPHVFIYCGLGAVALTIIDRSLRPTISLAQLVAITAGLAAIKLLPFLDFFWRFPRHIQSTDSMGPARIWQSLTIPDLHAHPELLVDAKWAFIEYGAYIGVIPAVLALVALIAALATSWRNNRLLFAALFPGAIFLLLAMGRVSDYAPWPLLHELPVFRSMRVPSRFLQGFVMALGLALAWGISALLTTVRRREEEGSAASSTGSKLTRLPLPILTICLAAWILGDLAWQTNQLLKPVFRIPPPTEQSPEMFRQVKGNPVQMYSFAKRNLGSVDAYEMMNFGPHVTPSESPGYRGEAYLLGDGEAAIAEWTPNEVTIRYSSEATNVLVINQNYSPDWKSDGPDVVNFEGRIAMVVEPGTEAEIILSYAPQSFFIGSSISLLTVVLLIYSGQQRRKNLASAPAPVNEPPLA